jgi:elongation factor P hydroxylase
MILFKTTDIAESLVNKPHCDTLIYLFNQAFGKIYATHLVRGGEEPEYIPKAATESHHQIIFTQDYFSSALHEIAHWCVAGDQRRLLRDYGYWYAPDGRDTKQQADFEQVEVKPQSLEWLFSRACGIRFRVSVDNLSANIGASDQFKRAILAQVHQYCQDGVNARAHVFITRLSAYYQTQDVFNPLQYHLASL